MKKRKILCWLILMVMQLSLFSVNAFASQPGRFVVSDATGEPGEIVEITVSIENNPGIIAAAMKINYDGGQLELISVKDEELLSGPLFSQSYDNNPYYASWMDALSTKDYSSDGVLMTLTFKIQEDCDDGETDIRLDFEPSDVFNWELKAQKFEAISGVVTIGDRKSDGSGEKEENESAGNKPGDKPVVIKPEEEKDSEQNETSEQSVVSSYQRFADLETGVWYQQYVEYMLDSGYMNGMSENMFVPDGNVTRAQLVTILYRMEGSPFIMGMANPFADVEKDNWYSDAVIWASANGIVNGVADDRFAPEQNITREQLATILYRYQHRYHGLGNGANNHLEQFIDVKSISSYAYDAMNWAAAAGIMNGSGGQLMPTASASRVQTAAMLTRYVEYIEKEPQLSVPTDPTLRVE